MNIKALWKTLLCVGLAYTVAMDWKAYERKIEEQVREA
jgi:hypothetical protein